MATATERIDRDFRELEESGFSGAVLVAKDDVTLLRAGYGRADHRNEVPVTPETAISTGSITKQFTATAILLLEQGGELSTEDSLGSFLDFVPVDNADITVYELLTHTSGLPDDDWDQHRETSSRDKYFEIARKAKLRSRPGSDIGSRSGRISWQQSEPVSPRVVGGAVRARELRCPCS